MKKICFPLGMALLLMPPWAVGAASLEMDFSNPPEAARLWTWWWWLGDKLDRDSITADLEALKAQGVGGVTVCSVSGPGVTDKGPNYMSPEWRDLFKHSLNESSRLGLGVSAMISSGWNAGGPWITPEQACKRRVHSQILLSGPQHFKGTLPRPPNNPTWYHDLAIQAIPIDPTKYRAVITASSSQDYYPASNAADGNLDSFWASKARPSKESPAWLQVDLGEPRVVKKVGIVPRKGFGPRDVELQLSSDGKEFATVKTLPMERDKALEVDLPQTPFRLLRLLMTSIREPWDKNVQICEVTLDGRPIRGGIPADLLAYKTADDSYKELGDSFDFAKDVRSGRTTLRMICDAPLKPWVSDDPNSAVDPSRIIDLTAKCDQQGRLEWDVPAGNWLIVRTGYTMTGAKLSWPTPGGAGLEVDPLDPAAMDFHFTHGIKPLVEDAGPLAGKVWRSLQMDSWEIYLPNWSSRFRDDFTKWRGYDPLPYFPVFTGVVIGSAEISDRFLYDYRKTLGDSVAENYFGRLSQLAEAHGLVQRSEAGGICFPKTMPMDALKNLGRCAIPMGEFWQTDEWRAGGQNISGKQTASAAHIYGKRIAAAEAFTSLAPNCHWEDSPSSLKPTADRAFCEGFNQFFIFSSATRSGEGFPGTELRAGTHFNRKITWWKEGRGFADYVARCSALLQKGRFAADVLFYNGDSCPNYVSEKHVDPLLGPGYDYDVCNTEVLLTRLRVEDGRIVLPDGMSYRILVLPDVTTMPVEVMAKLKELVAAGLTVIGAPPTRAPGLRDYPRCDAEIKAAAAELWGDCDGRTITAHPYGRGLVVQGQSSRMVLQAKGVRPDFEYSRSNAMIDWIHRSVPVDEESTAIVRAGESDAEVYFLANRGDRSERVDCIFRVNGKVPELWDPVTGAVRALTDFEPTADGRTFVPLNFAAGQSYFIVFRQEASSLGGADRQVTRNFPELKSVLDLSGPWTVTFDSRWGGPSQPVDFDRLQDWTERSESGIKYYSGKAVYRKAFDLPFELRKANPERGSTGKQREGSPHYVLDLGEVRDLAHVRLNGKDLGVVWTAPWQVDLTAALKPEGNQLEVEVVNPWKNRLIGDASLPEAERLTRTNVETPVNSPLLSSGLLGPVKVLESRNAMKR